MSTFSTSIIIPAYNEEEAIGSTLRKMTDLGLDRKYEIIVVDDGSNDGTGSVAAEFPVRLIRHHVNKGYGAALKTGIRNAQGDFIIFMDSDGQHTPDSIETIEKMLQDHDLVIGVRTGRSHQVQNRRLGKWLIRKVGEYLVEQKLPDYNSGYRGFRKELISSMLHMMPNGFSFSTTSTLAFIKEGYNIATFPVTVTERVGRKSNVRFFRDGSKTLLLLFRIIMLFNPLKVFFPASLTTFIAGLAFGIYGFIRFGRFANGAVVLITLGMFLFFIGLLADQISVMNRRNN
ncbi:MAG: glycosyltransferase family 2 protein [Bacteroidales bacterium]|nr:glycosyltransferase family 2 protein [Bacteroidales bacterium]MBN2698112.1 glycosyltransferase family 2 protein [Bacteroidales bacterium]